MGLFTKRQSPEPVTTAVSLEADRTYWISYKCRDIGYGVEEGGDYFVYVGPADRGKLKFAPAGGAPAIYLFPDEITYAADADAEG